MLSLAPLSGLQAAIKRRNSKLARRDSISIERSTLALPSTIRRFSSSEALNSQQSSAPSVATVSRISSFSRKIRKISAGSRNLAGSNPAQTELVDSCNVLDLHIAQIKRKLAEFREEDVDISERVEELTNALGDMCQNYRIPVGTLGDYRIPVDGKQSLPHLNTYLHMLHGTETSRDQLEREQDYLEEDEEEFQKFCHAHTYLQGSSSRHFGYSTLPLPPNRAGERKAIAPVAHHPKRSQSYEGHHMHDHGNYDHGNYDHGNYDHGNYDHGNYATLSFRENVMPRNSYPWSFNGHEDDFYCTERSQFEASYQGSYPPRPQSYQDISYDENDYEETGTGTDGCWSELSCP